MFSSSLLAPASADAGSARRDVYTVSCMHVCYCFQGDSLLADFASLMQESKERCIYSKLYAVLTVLHLSLLSCISEAKSASNEPP